MLYPSSDFKRSSHTSECETEEAEKDIQISLDCQQEEEVPDDQSDANLPRPSD